MEGNNYDVIVIGSGPGGYVAAIRAAQLGLKTAIVERAELGGICLNWGCIPTKALLKSAQAHHYAQHATDYGLVSIHPVSPDITQVVQRSRDIAASMSKGVAYLLKKNNVDTIFGIAKIQPDKTVCIVGADNVTTHITAPHIILATGARPRELPSAPIDGIKIIGYRQALTPSQIPESLAIIGSGAIGSEFAHFYNAMGTKVTLIEFLDNIVPLEDEEVSALLSRSFRKVGIKVMTSSEVLSVDTSGSFCRLSVKTKKGIEEVEASQVLSAVGVTPNIENIGLEALGICVERGRIWVDNNYQTNVSGIYAIGDLLATPALAHVASAEAIHCIEKIAGLHPPKICYDNIPGCTYTSPEIASVGLTEKGAKEKGFDVKIGKFPFTASGKAASAGERDGFVKLIFDAVTEELLGAHLIGANVTEMISGLVVARQLGVKGKDIIHSIHPHPTMSEAIMEAAAAAHGEVIHL
ncbi:MAG: dihydrolipoyl dehydrogenase [Prevotellaceae bacterium]|jgi:dihydrolipoamide dehydrogenase|nr:dihydrolipoyl dehydrogenase [Prevotellaceae bacterium]